MCQRLKRTVSKWCLLENMCSDYTINTFSCSLVGNGSPIEEKFSRKNHCSGKIFTPVTMLFYIRQSKTKTILFALAQHNRFKKLNLRMDISKHTRFLANWKTYKERFGWHRSTTGTQEPRTEEPDHESKTKQKHN